MAQLGGTFNAHDHDALGDRTPLPDGWYTVVITNSEWKTGKNNGPQYLELTCEVVDGDHKGRLLWDRLNLQHASDKAREYANRALSSIARAVNVLHVTDTVQLHGIPFDVKVTVVQDEGYEPKNEVKNYRAAGAPPAAAPAMPRPAAGRAPAPATPPTPKWAQKPAA